MYRNLALGLQKKVPIWMGIAPYKFVFKNFQTRKVKAYYKQLLDNANVPRCTGMQQEIKSYSMQDEVRRDVLQDRKH